MSDENIIASISEEAVRWKTKFESEREWRLSVEEEKNNVNEERKELQQQMNTVILELGQKTQEAQALKEELLVLTSGSSEDEINEEITYEPVAQPASARSTVTLAELQRRIQSIHERAQKRGIENATFAKAPAYIRQTEALERLQKHFSIAKKISNISYPFSEEA